MCMVWSQPKERATGNPILLGTNSLAFHVHYAIIVSFLPLMSLQSLAGPP